MRTRLRIAPVFTQVEIAGGHRKPFGFEFQLMEVGKSFRAAKDGLGIRNLRRYGAAR
jgi:hypothetical protein